MSACGVLRILEGNLLAFWCEGCKTMHAVNTGWAFNGNYDHPTFTPSILIRGGHFAQPNKPCWCTYNVEHPDKPTKFECILCHSFVTDGMIQFLSDCSHHLAGQTILLKPF